MRRRDRLRSLRYQQLEKRFVFTLPATLTFAEGSMVTYNGPTVDSVNDTLSFNAFIDFAGDIDSYILAPQFSGTYTIDVGDFGNTVDPEVAVYVASTGARVGYNDDISEFNDDAHLVLNLVADVRYIIAVADFPNTTPGNVSILVAASFRTGSFLMAPDVFGDASASVLLDIGTDIDYYSITAPPNATGGLIITTSASTLNHRLALFNSSGTLVQGPLVSINFPSVDPNAEYRIAVFSSDYSTAGTLTLNIDFAVTGAIVANTLDSGPGSLRQAILDANAHSNVNGQIDKIVFNIPGAGPHNIVLASELPAITEAVDIIGGTQPGTVDTPSVAIDGSSLTGTIDGLTVQALGTAIRMLNIRNFPGDGIEVQASSVLLEDNTIGTDWGGLAGMGNKGYGVNVLNGAGNRIDSNVISSNKLGGVSIAGGMSVNNEVVGNTIGAAFGGKASLPNIGNGVTVTNSDQNTVSNNLISGNTRAGVLLTGNATANKVVGNKIGTKDTGNTALPNGGDGIVIESSGNQIGGNQPTLRNIISGNAKAGIVINGVAASNNVIEGNFVGTTLNGTKAVPNVGDGIRVVGAPNNRIGSDTESTARNVISGNGGSGVTLSQAGVSGTLVVGNYIGIASNGTLGLGNANNGVSLTAGATNVQIGGSTGLSQNIVSANLSNGIAILSDSNNNRVSRNRIGMTTADVSLGNLGSGVFIAGPNNLIGGINANFKNTIGGNGQGITLSGATAKNNTIKFNVIGLDTAPNAGSGIQFASGSSENAVGPSNTIRRNGTGIRVNDGSTKNRLTRNSISENFGVGIDLIPTAGATANDGSDADTGANLLQNWPAISGSPVLIGSAVEIAFRVPSTPANAAYPLTIEFFVSDGGGEGAKFVGSTVYTATNFTAGVKTVSFAGAGAGLIAGTSKIVGTATDASGNTSEFSTQKTVVSGAARFSAVAQPSVSRLDLNGDGVVGNADAASLLSVINDKSSGASGARTAAAQSGTSRYDITGDGVINSSDLRLLVRSIQTVQSAKPSTLSREPLVDISFWDAVLRDLDVKELLKA